ncbi:MAG: hypothetical protein R6V85_09755 [Polyangia bacterium]
MASRSLTEQVKVGLAAGAMLAVVAGSVLARLRARAAKNEGAREFLERTPVVSIGRLRLNARQAFIAALLAFALFGTLNYNRYGTDLIVDGYDEYDLLHYYVAPKYFEELGYFRLLPALIIADYESKPMCPGRTPIYLYQDEEDYERKSYRHALARREEIKSHFTDERWEQFVHDVTYIQRDSKRLLCRLWRQLLQDHGFNGTATWTFVARPIVSLVPVEHIKLATLLDLVLIIAMLIAILWAFGAEAFLLAWIYIGICYSFRWPTITWVMLRYDWMTTMVIGICMMKRRRNWAAGAFFGYATLMRYFPALWLFGIAAKGVHALFARRGVPLSRFWLRIPVRYYKMAGGFFLTLVLLGGAAGFSLGFDAHEQSLKNMLAHIEPHNLSSMRQGLQIALTWRGETEQKLISNEERELVAELETPVRIAALAMMVILGLFMSRVRDWEAVGLGVIPYFWLTTSSYYYYSMRMTAVVIHAADLSKRRNVVGLLMLFGIECFCHASQHIKKGNRYFLISVMGISLAVYSLTMVGFLAHEWWTKRRRGVDPDWVLPGEKRPACEREESAGEVRQAEKEAG